MRASLDHMMKCACRIKIKDPFYYLVGFTFKNEILLSNSIIIDPIPGAALYSLLYPCLGRGLKIERMRAVNLLFMPKKAKNLR